MINLKPGTWVCVSFGVDVPVVYLARAVEPSVTEPEIWWCDVYLGWPAGREDLGPPTLLMFRADEILGVPSARLLAFAESSLPPAPPTEETEHDETRTKLTAQDG